MAGLPIRADQLLISEDSEDGAPPNRAISPVRRAEVVSASTSLPQTRTAERLKWCSGTDRTLPQPAQPAESANDDVTVVSPHVRAAKPSISSVSGQAGQTDEHSESLEPSTVPERYLHSEKVCRQMSREETGRLVGEIDALRQLLRSHGIHPPGSPTEPSTELASSQGLQACLHTASDDLRLDEVTGRVVFRGPTGMPPFPIGRQSSRRHLSGLFSTTTMLET